MPMSQYAAKETMQRRNQTAVGEEERKVLEVSFLCSENDTRSKNYIVFRLINWKTRPIKHWKRS
jgi:hypothetical protein